MNQPAEEVRAPVLDRAAAVLDALMDRRPATLSEVSRRTQLPRTTTHRILQQLTELQWVSRSGSEYCLGLRLFEFGTRVFDFDDLAVAAIPAMTRLHERLGPTVYLSALVGSDLVHIERIGPAPGRGPGWRVGDRQPADSTIAGRILLTRSSSHVAVDAAGNRSEMTVVAAPIRSAGARHRAVLSAYSTNPALTPAQLAAAAADVSRAVAAIRNRQLRAVRGTPCNATPFARAASLA